MQVYHTYFKPLEWTVSEREDNACYAKLICHKLDRERVVGFHVLGPNAGEVTQGFGAAMKCVLSSRFPIAVTIAHATFTVRAGATKTTFDLTVGIHPTTAEEFTTLGITKRSGEPAQKQGC